jgi:cytochrome c oxidase subunit II
MRLWRRRPLLGLVVVSLLSIAVGLAIALSIDWFPTQGSTAARKIDHLYDVLLIFSVPIFVLVMSVAIYSVLTFRVKPGDMSDGAPIHGHTMLEVVWVTVPFLIVTGLAAYAWVVLDDIEAKKKDALIVAVTARQFNWSFEYPNEGHLKSNELILPNGRPVEFRIRTKDVIHSFWVPEFRLKSDTPPGLTSKVRLTPSRVGQYRVVCAELCGIGHSTMRQTVRVLPPNEFHSWLARRQQAARREGAFGEGRRLYTAVGCAGCHTLVDAGAEAETGPPLEGLGEIFQKRRPGKSLREYLRESIVDPKAFVVSGFSPQGMPANYPKQLTKAEIHALVEYLARATRRGEAERPRGARGR